MTIIYKVTDLELYDREHAEKVFLKEYFVGIEVTPDPGYKVANPSRAVICLVLQQHLQGDGLLLTSFCLPNNPQPEA